MLVDSTEEEHQECKLIGLEEQSSLDDIFSTLDHNDMVIDIALSESLQSDELYHESKVGCERSILPSEDVLSTNKRSLDVVHMKTRAVQHKCDGITSFLGIHASDHQQTLLGVYGDSKIVSWRIISQNFRLGAAVFIWISQHMILIKHIQAGWQ